MFSQTSSWPPAQTRKENSRIPTYAMHNYTFYIPIKKYANQLNWWMHKNLHGLHPPWFPHLFEVWNHGKRGFAGDFWLISAPIYSISGINYFRHRKILSWGPHQFHANSDNQSSVIVIRIHPFMTSTKKSPFTHPFTLLSSIDIKFSNPPTLTSTT